MEVDVAEDESRRPSADVVRYVTLVALGAAVGGLLFGFDTSTVNSAINGARDTLDMGAGAVGFVAAIALLGAAVGAWFAGPVASRLGRTRVMLIAGVLLVIGSLGAALSNGVVVMGLFRVASGMGIGAASAVVPAYISEVSPPSIRGRMGSMWQLAIVIGQLLGLISGWALTEWAGGEAEALPMGGAAWRWMFAVVVVLALLYVGVSRVLPWTPPDMVRLGREDEARAMLRKVGDDDPEAHLAELKVADAAGSGHRDLRVLLGGRFGLKGIVWTGLGLAAFQQLVGINVVKTYSNTLWQAVGFSSSVSFTISIVTVLISVASTVVAIAIIDRVGRRLMLRVGAAVMAGSLGTLALALGSAGGERDVPDQVGDVVTSSAQDLALSDSAATVALVAINVFAVAFGITWGPVMWVMLSELFDSDLRTTAVAVCTAVNWGTNWLVTRTFPSLADAGLGLAYGIYTAFAVLAFVFAMRALPETGGKRLR